MVETTITPIGATAIVIYIVAALLLIVLIAVATWVCYRTRRAPVHLSVSPPPGTYDAPLVVRIQSAVLDEYLVTVSPQLTGISPTGEVCLYSTGLHTIRLRSRHRGGGKELAEEELIYALRPPPPRIFPGSGVILENTWIKIFTAKTHSMEATVKYSVDGGPPSTVYLGPFLPPVSTLRLLMLQQSQLQHQQQLQSPTKVGNEHHHHHHHPGAHQHQHTHGIHAAAPMRVLACTVGNNGLCSDVVAADLHVESCAVELFDPHLPQPTCVVTTLGAAITFLQPQAVASNMPDGGEEEEDLVHTLGLNHHHQQQPSPKHSLSSSSSSHPPPMTAIAAAKHGIRIYYLIETKTGITLGPTLYDGNTPLQLLGEVNLVVAWAVVEDKSHHPTAAGVGKPLTAAAAPIAGLTISSPTATTGAPTGPKDHHQPVPVLYTRAVTYGYPRQAAALGSTCGAAVLQGNQQQQPEDHYPSQPACGCSCSSSVLPRNSIDKIPQQVIQLTEDYHDHHCGSTCGLKNNNHKKQHKKNQYHHHRRRQRRPFESELEPPIIMIQCRHASLRFEDPCMNNIVLHYTVNGGHHPSEQQHQHQSSTFPDTSVVTANSLAYAHGTEIDITQELLDCPPGGLQVNAKYYRHAPASTCTTSATGGVGSSGRTHHLGDNVAAAGTGAALGEGVPGLTTYGPEFSRSFFW